MSSRTIVLLTLTVLGLCPGPVLAQSPALPEAAKQAPAPETGQVKPMFELPRLSTSPGHVVRFSSDSLQRHAGMTQHEQTFPLPAQGLSGQPGLSPAKGYAAGMLDPSLPLSPACQELARHMGILPLVEELSRLRHQDHETGTTPPSRELWVRQELTEKVIVSMLEVRGASAAINRDICEGNEMGAYLTARRDHRILLNSLANMVSGTLGECVGSSFQIPGTLPRLDRAGNIIELLGGAVQGTLSALALRQQKGERRSLKSEANMLAKLFDQPTGTYSDYPPIVWDFLNSIPAGAADGQTRRQHLINNWVNLKRVVPRNNPGFKDSVAQLTCTSSGRQVFTIDLLANRAAMLSDVAALVADVDLLLLELMQYVSLQH